VLRVLLVRVWVLLVWIEFGWLVLVLVGWVGLGLLLFAAAEDEPGCDTDGGQPGDATYYAADDGANGGGARLCLGVGGGG
jgi:hypothetical protein